MKFKSKTALISGGLGDIGQETAVQLAREGANISIADIQDPAKAKNIKKLVEDCGGKFLYTQADLSKANNVLEWHNNTVQQIGTPDIIIYSSAIINKVSSFMELSNESWENEININLNSAFYLTKIASESLIKKNMPGHIVLIGSWAAHKPHAHIPSYSVAKAGLRMLCKCIAKELAPKNIIVNEIAPGYVDAGLSGLVFNQDPAIKEKCQEQVPNKQLISKEEVAQNILFLCDPNNKHFIGSTLLMDGGLSL